MRLPPLALLLPGCILLLLSACAGGGRWNGHSALPITIINTTENTFQKDGKWHSNAGPLSARFGGLACDNTVGDMRFHTGEYLHWHIAPSDSTPLPGMRRCLKNPDGEPSCSENWSLCGRKVRVRCVAGDFCGKAGEPSLVARINHGRPPVNNYLPGFFVDELTRKFGRSPPVAASVVLYITDFCPAEHSNNKQARQCQRPQIDVSTSAFLLLGKTNEQGYINSNTRISIELLDSDDPSPAGPEYR